MNRRKGSVPGRRHGVATVELALLLPFLCFLFAVAIDYARIFYFGVTVENCARNGAYYASRYPNSNYVYNDIYGYTSMDDAVTRDASNLSANGGAAPTYTVYYSSSSSGPFTQTTEPSSGGYVQVTVNWTFTSLTNYPGLPSSVNVSRQCVMQIAPSMPTFSSSSGG
jgi:Flp pilus assembly protein TadG